MTETNPTTDIDAAIAEAERVIKMTQPSTPTANENTAAGTKNPLSGLSLVPQELKTLNENISWARNAAKKISGLFNACVKQGRHAWDNGLGQSLGTAGRWGERLCKGYARLFNRLSHITDKTTGKKQFSRLRAAFVIAATLAAPVAVWHGTGPVMDTGYDVAARLFNEKDETLWVYNATPVEGKPYTWWIYASDNPSTLQGKQERLLLEKVDLAYMRFRAGSEEIAAKVTATPTQAKVKLSGWRIVVPPYGMVDIHRKVQGIEYIDSAGPQQAP